MQARSKAELKQPKCMYMSLMWLCFLNRRTFMDSSAKNSMSICILVLFAILLMSSSPVHCKSSDEDKLLEGINNYRIAQKLPVLKENDEADCLADEIADSLEDHPCNRPVSTNFADYPKQLKRCKVDINSTRDAVILPACVPHLVSTQLLGNYTQNPIMARAVNDTRYANIGLGSQDDWMVVILSTTTATGSLASGAFRNMLGLGSSFTIMGMLLVLVAN